VSGGDAEPVTLEMGYSLTEFARTLPLAMRDWPVSGGAPEWWVDDPVSHSRISVGVSVESQRRIGVLSLPVLRVRIDPGGTSGAVMAEFMRRFERGFHRGGG
jgi:hypothetical protein